MAGINFNKVIYEGWTVGKFIEHLEPIADMVMRGEAIEKPFKDLADLKKWVANNLPYLHKPIPDVVKYFAKKYGIKERGMER